MKVAAVGLLASALGEPHANRPYQQKIRMFEIVVDQDLLEQVDKENVSTMAKLIKISCLPNRIVISEDRRLRAGINYFAAAQLAGLDVVDVTVVSSVDVYY